MMKTQQAPRRSEITSINIDLFDLMNILPFEINLNVIVYYSYGVFGNVSMQYKSTLSVQRGAPTFDAGKAFAMMAASSIICQSPLEV